MPWQTTSAGSSPRFDVVERRADAHLLLRRRTRRRGTRSRGRRRRTRRTAPASSACTSANERSVQSPASVSIRRGVLARLEADARGDDVGRFARAQQRAAPQRREPVARPRARPARRPARGRSRRAGPAAGPGSGPRGCRRSGRGGPGRRCARLTRRPRLAGARLQHAALGGPTGSSSAGRRYRNSYSTAATVAPSSGPAYQTQPLAQWSPTSCGPNARDGFIAAPVNGPPKSTSIVIVRPIARPAIDLNVPRASTAAGEHHPHEEERQDRLQAEARARVHAVAERRHAEVHRFGGGARQQLLHEQRRRAPRRPNCATQ